MAFVGMLDQLQLSHIFKHIQFCEQTGLLTIARGEQRSPALTVPSQSDTGRLSDQASVPSRAASLPYPSSDTPTIRLSTPGTRINKQSARGVSGRRYMALAGVLLLFAFFMQGALAWAPIQGA